MDIERESHFIRNGICEIELTKKRFQQFTHGVLGGCAVSSSLNGSFLTSGCNSHMLGAVIFCDQAEIESSK